MSEPKIHEMDEREVYRRFGPNQQKLRLNRVNSTGNRPFLRPLAASTSTKQA
jgi:hypothetical protein